MADEQNQDYPAGVDNVHASFSMDSPPLEACPPLPDLSWREFLQWMMGRRSRHRIEGRSMLPTLKPGDELLYRPSRRGTDPPIGALVIAQHPHEPDLRMIKRIAAVQQETYWLLGDNRLESSDSRKFGWLSSSHILGIATCQFSEADTAVT